MLYVMADIHGHYDKFLKMLNEIQFSDQDKMIIIGDVIDRGPDGIKMLRDIMGRENIIMTMGNHELMMINSLLGGDGADQEECIANWIRRNGGNTTAEELDKLTDDETYKIIEWVLKLPTAINIEVDGRKFHLVHGFPAEDCYDALWGRPKLNTPNPMGNDVTLIVGHTPVMFLHAEKEDELLNYINYMTAKGDHLKIEHTKGFIDIDCGAGQNLPISRLACIRLDDMKEFYV